MTMAPTEADRIRRETRLQSLADKQKHLEDRLQEQISHCERVHVGMDKVLAGDRELEINVIRIKHDLELKFAEFTEDIHVALETMGQRQKLVMWFLGILVVSMFAAGFEWAFDIIPSPVHHSTIEVIPK